MIKRFARVPSRPAGLALGCVLAAGPATAADLHPLVAQAPDLAWGQQTPVLVTEDKPAIYAIQLDEPGIVTVAAAGVGEIDLWVSVADESSQEIFDARIDHDARELPHGEFGSVAVTKPGRYLVVAGSWSGQSVVQLKATFTAVPGLVHRDDPQGDPGQAVELTLGQPLEQSLNLDEGDRRDWFKLVPEQTGRVVVTTRTPDGSDLDVLLEAYDANAFWDSAHYSDEDLNDSYGHEKLDLDVRRGEPIYLRVEAWDDGNEGALPYTIEATGSASPPRGQRAPVAAEPQGPEA
jgi:hypothetical protein